MTNEFFVPELKDVDEDDLWLQQHGTKCHTSNDTTNLLKATLGERIISRRMYVAWKISYDLKPA